MQQERECQTIYFKDLLFRALYRWKIALAVALVLAVVMGGVGLLKSTASVNLNTATLTPEMQQKIDLLRNNIEVTRRNIELQEEYTENSLFLQVNPYALYTAGFHVVVYPESMVTSAADASAIDNTSAIIRAYQSAMNDPQTIEEIARELEMQPLYMAELIYTDLSVDGSLGFGVRGNAAEDVQKIADAVQATLEEKTPQISKQVENHSVKIVPFKAGPKIDTSLYEAQNSAYQKLTTLTNNLTSMEAELKRLEPTGLNSIKFSPAVLAVIGGILGVALTALCAWVAHIGGTKVYSAKALSGCTGIRVLGCIPGEKKYDPVTGWLRKLEGRSSCDVSKAVAGDIRNRCKDGKNLLIVGRYAQPLLSGLTEELNRSGMQVTMCGGMEDPAVFEALSQSDFVLLAETCMHSRYDSVQKMMQTVSDYNKALLGCLLIDG